MLITHGRAIYAKLLMQIFLQIAIIMCVCIDMHSMQSVYLARRIYEITCRK
jgi:hypothetical protein